MYILYPLLNLYLNHFNYQTFKQQLDHITFLAAIFWLDCLYLHQIREKERDFQVPSRDGWVDR